MPASVNSWRIDLRIPLRRVPRCGRGRGCRALLAAPAAAAPATTTTALRPSVVQSTDAAAGAAAVHRKSANCSTPRGQKINVSWGDGNVTTTVYFNNHCQQKWTIQLQFVSQRDVFWKCVTVNPRTSGRKKVDNGSPNKVILSTRPTHC